MGKVCLLCSDSIPHFGYVKYRYNGWCSATTLDHEVVIGIEAIHDVAEVRKVL